MIRQPEVYYLEDYVLYEEVVNMPSLMGILLTLHVRALRF